jgi:signal transduction histidine kinase
VLAPQFRHYADDLRRVGQTGARLIEALATHSDSLPAVEPTLTFKRHPFPGIQDLPCELLALEEPLRALAGPEIQLDVECAACLGELALNAEDLVRILFNLVANTVEAIRSASAPRSGANRRPFLRITAQLGSGASFLPELLAGPPSSVVISVRDNGPGIAAEDLPHIFDTGFSTRGKVRRLANASLNRGSHSTATSANDSHGLGLAIVRQLVEAAGGSVRAVSSPGIGVRFDIELPIVGPGVAQKAVGYRVETTGLPLTNVPPGSASSVINRAKNRPLKRFPQTVVKGAYNATNNRN